MARCGTELLTVLSPCQLRTDCRDSLVRGPDPLAGSLKASIRRHGIARRVLHHSSGPSGGLWPAVDQRLQVGDELLLGGNRLQKNIEGGVVAGESEPLPEHL